MAKFRLKALQPTEHQTQAAILRYLAMSQMVVFAHRMNSGFVKIDVPGGRDRFLRCGFKGCSDVIGMLNDGRILAIEVKSPTGLATNEQQAFLDIVVENGGVSVLARSVDDVVNALEKAYNAHVA